jgi:plastocyanin
MAVGMGACQLADKGNDLPNGKKAFVAKCGACHMLQRAGTTGVVGPDLDEAFHRALQDGIKRSTVEGVVRDQIAVPSTTSQVDPKTGKEAGTMPANIVEGETAEDVAAYVAYATARTGEDTGRLADFGVKKATASATAQNGLLSIPADPSGALAYKFAAATAPAGPITIESKNDASVPHDIAIEGGGLNEHGEVVQGGGVSKITADLKPGDYTFFCSVPGHRQGGMEGRLTVK